MRRPSLQRQALNQHINAEIIAGRLQPGMGLPSVRTLADRFRTSRDTVQTELQSLVATGLLRVERSRGFFVADRGNPACFLMVLPDLPGELLAAHAWTAEQAFETRIAEHGGSAVCLRAAEYEAHRDRFPPLSGVFGFRPGELSAASLTRPDGERIPVAEFGISPNWAINADLVDFDHVLDAHEATMHLVDRGYRRIAFLPRHHRRPERTPRWARERERGWRQAIATARTSATIGIRLDGGDQPWTDTEDHMLEANVVSSVAIGHRAEFDAVVAVDDWAALSLLRAWRAAGLPTTELPAIVGFEGLQEAAQLGITSMLTPWHDVGTTAADLLWQRSVGQITGPAVSRLLTGRMAARMSSLPEAPVAGLAGHGS